MKDYTVTYNTCLGGLKAMNVNAYNEEDAINKVKKIVSDEYYNFKISSSSITELQIKKNNNL
jgi:hypothetical protein